MICLYLYIALRNPSWNAACQSVIAHIQGDMHCLAVVQRMRALTFQLPIYAPYSCTCAPERGVLQQATVCATQAPLLGAAIATHGRSGSSLL